MPIKQVEKLKKREEKDGKRVGRKSTTDLEAKPQWDPAPLSKGKRSGGKHHKRDFDWFHRLMYSYETARHEKQRLKKQYPEFNERFKHLKRQGEAI